VSRDGVCIDLHNGHVFGAHSGCGGIFAHIQLGPSGPSAILYGLTDVEHEHVFFDVLLHLGTFISVCIVYRQDIAEMIYEFFVGLPRCFPAGIKAAAASRTAYGFDGYILGTLPLFAVFPVKDAVEGLYANPLFIGCALIFTGFVLFFSDRMARGRKTARSATVADALLVGCAQAIAVVPGISRSGATISAGMLRGFDRRFAVRFSFLLSLPAILGANLIHLADAVRAGFDTSLLPVYLAGVAVATVSGCFSLLLVSCLPTRENSAGLPITAAGRWHRIAATLIFD
jgi:undecaprenyl-diphosphatase